MTLDEAIVEGTLMPDGTLQLDQTPSVSPGRVQVTIKQMASTPTSPPGLAEVILQIQRDQAARGFVGLSAQDLADEQKARQEEEDDYDRCCKDLWAQTQSGPPK